VVEDMIIVREVIARDNVYASILLYPPMCVPESLALVEEFFL
jgi:hypothetical protein